jgi:hypothetical protein
MRPFNFLMSVELIEDLRVFAKEKGVSVSGAMRMALLKFIRDWKKQKKEETDG